MVRRSFFTREMGLRLRQLRLSACLTQDDVAERMGLTGRRRMCPISEIERGRVGNPTLCTIATYLKAVGARWGQFADLLERIECVPIPTEAVEDSDLPDKIKRRVADDTDIQCWRYELELPYRKGTKPVHPNRLRVAAERMRNYRLVVNIIEQDVAAVLATTDVNLLAYPGYRAVGRQALGLLWRMAKSARQRAEFTKGGVLPGRIRTRLEEKTVEWEKLRLDPAVIRQVQAAVIERFGKLMAAHPELLPEAK